MQTIEQNILDAGVDAIAHCCNCQNIMGAGVAAVLRKAHPEIFEADKKASDLKRNTLGSFSVARISNPKTFRFCFNLYGQEYPGGSERPVNYEAIYSSLEKMRDSITSFNKRTTPLLAINSVSFPYKMASDLAGGDWRIIEKMIEVVFEGSGVDVIISKYQPK